jgi:hypothetical protein
MSDDKDGHWEQCYTRRGSPMRGVTGKRWVNHKGYRLTDRPLDWQDRVVLCVCVGAALALVLIVMGVPL